MNKFSKTTRNFFIFPSFFLLIFGSSVWILKAQEDIKRDVAIITGSKGSKQTINYSDLLFLLALEPKTPLNPPRSEDLKRVFQTIINLSLIIGELENVRVPCQNVTEAEIKNEINRVVSNFSSPDEFERRFKAIGFASIEDDNFRRVMSFRVTIEKLIHLRFRTFVIFKLEEEEKYYRDVFAPDFRRRNPGLLVPALPEVRWQIRQILEEKRIASEIDKFLDYARPQVKIEILSDELK